uniref:PiggyBac transposable element-derived protein domain-containing protein n=1 Tax=Amphimedon queenslandica TaxID=400682 RepID=A0A1X7V767_AMPQE
MEDDLDIENDEVAVEDNDCDVDFDVESDDEEDKQDDETVIIDNSDITDIENDDLDNTIKDVSIDEAMIPFQGRSTHKQYMPMKPIKGGLKVWTLSNGKTGYVSQFEVYTGKKGNSVENGLGASVVMNLSSHLRNKYRNETSSKHCRSLMQSSLIGIVWMWDFEEQM